MIYQKRSTSTAHTFLSWILAVGLSKREYKQSTHVFILNPCCWFIKEGVQAQHTCFHPGSLLLVYKRGSTSRAHTFSSWFLAVGLSKREYKQSTHDSNLDPCCWFIKEGVQAEQTCFHPESLLLVYKRGSTSRAHMFATWILAVGL